MKKLIIFFVLLGVFSVRSQETKEKDKLKFQEYFFEAMNNRLKEDLKKSNRFFEKCLAIEPENDVIFYKIAQNYHQMKNDDEALRYIERARKINRDNKWYEKEFIEIKMSMLPYKESVKLIRSFEKRAKNKYIIRQLYRNLYDISAQSKLSKQIAKQVSLKNRFPELKNLVQAQKYKQATRLGEQILEMHPDDAKTYYFTALAYKQLQKYNNALDFLDMGMDFVLRDKALLKDYYSLYIELYRLKGKPNKEKKYKQKLKNL